MVKRSKKQKRTAQLLAVGALTVSTVAPYAVSAEDVQQNTNTTGQQDEQNLNSSNAQTLSVTTDDSASVEEVKLEAGYYKISYRSFNDKGVETRLPQTGLASHINSLPAEVNVNESGEYEVTMYVNREYNNTIVYKQFEVLQNDKPLEVKVLESSIAGNGENLPKKISFTTNNLADAVKFKLHRHKSTSITEFTTTFDVATATAINEDETVLKDFSNLKDGIYEVNVTSLNTSDLSTAATNILVNEKATLRVENNRYFLTAQFSGPNTGDPKTTYSLHTMNNKVYNWGSLIVSYFDELIDDTTRTTTATFEIGNPNEFIHISSSKDYYDLEVQTDHQHVTTALKVDVNSLQLKEEIQEKQGYFKAPFKMYSDTRYQLSKDFNSIIGNTIAIEAVGDKTYYTLPIYNGSEAEYKDVSVEGGQVILNEAGVPEAIRIEATTFGENPILKISATDKGTGTVKNLTLYLTIDYLNLEQLDQPYQFKAEPFIGNSDAIADGVYSVDVNLYDNIAPFNFEAATPSSKIKIENVKLDVKDGKKKLYGTIKNISSREFVKNLAFENEYGQFSYSPITIIKDINLDMGLYDIDFSIDVNDLDVPQRLQYDTSYKSFPDSTSNTKVINRLVIDSQSLRPYEAPADEGESAPFYMTAASTNDMDIFIANYLNEYFERPAKIIEENDKKYALVNITGKMYIADEIKYVKADGTEELVEFVYDNGLTGLQRVRTIKIPLENSKVKMFVNGESFGSYYFNLDFQLKEKAAFSASLLSTTDSNTAAGNIFIEGIQKPAVVYVEAGKYVAEISFTGNMNAAKSVVAVDSSGAELPTTIVYDDQKTDESRIYTIKVPLEGDTIDLQMTTNTDVKHTFRLKLDKSYKVQESTNDVEKEVVNGVSDVPTEDTNINFNFKVPSSVEETQLLVKLQKLLKEAIAKRIVSADNKPKIKISIPINNKDSIKKLIMKQNGKEVGRWQDSSGTVASLRAIASTDVLTAELESLDNITFEAYETVATTTPVTATVESIEKVKEVTNNNEGNETGTNPTAPDGSTGGNSGTTPGGNTGGGSTTTPDFNNEGQVTVEKSISHSFTAQEVSAGIYGSVPGSFIENYLAPYFTNAQLVTVNGSKYIEMTLIGKGYGVKSFGGGTFVSSTGSGLNQVRVLRIPAAKQSTHRVDAGDYGIYDLTFSFGVTDADLAGSSGSTTGSGTNTGETKPEDVKPQVVDVESTGDADMKLALTEENKALSSIINKFNTVFKDGKFNVKISLTNTNNVKQFIVKQDGKEIARWNNPKTTAYVASLFGAKLASTATELAFEVASLEGLTVEAVTESGSLTGAIQATSKVEAQKPELAEGEIAYTIHPDPTDDAGEFIVNYLKPYFSKAKEVVIDGKQYVELTLTGKAYGFEKIQYADASGKLQDVTIVSSTGEKLEQVRVIRLPLVKDANGLTKLHVDSGDLGYGAYNLFFNFDVGVKGDTTGEVEGDKEPETEAEVKPIVNPFKDIDKSGFKDDILAIYAAGITTGTTKTTFSPNKNITRAQFAVMIARALDLSPTKATQFKDIKGKSYENAVQALYEAGIVTGVNAETFNPGKEITRQQAAAMIYRMLTYKGFKGSATAADLNFKDVNKVQSYAKLALAELQKQQIMTGSNGYIKATDNLTRGQMAKVLKRSLELIDFKF